MADQGLDKVSADALKKLNQQKIAKESELEILKSKVHERLDAKADRKTIEMNATEFKRMPIKVLHQLLVVED